MARPQDSEPFAIEYEQFKWNILGDAVFEDWQGLWEPLWALRGDYAIEGLSEPQRQALAERALRELYAEGLIYFFRVPPWAEVNASAENESLRVTSERVDEALRGDWWRGRKGLPEDHPSIWWGPTEAGERACQNPPAHIRDLWRLDAAAEAQPDERSSRLAGGPLRRLLRRMGVKRSAPEDEGPSRGIIGQMYGRSLDAPPPPPLRERLAAFSRDRTSEDELPAEIAAQVRSFDASLSIEERSEAVEVEARGAPRLPLLGRAFRRDLDSTIKAELEAMERKSIEEQGRHVPEESRLLLRDLGVERRQLYAIPTTTGQVGIYLVGGNEPGIGGWLVAALPEKLAWQISYEREPGKPTRLVVFGLVADDVAAVEVELNGQTAPAALANNGFFYEAEGREPTEVAALILRRHAGGERRIPIKP